MEKDKRKGYQWPASNITIADMEVLVKQRKRTGKPISYLLHDAVKKAYISKQQYLLTIE